MSPEMAKMWISIAGMFLMFLAISLIYLSRFKLKGFFQLMTGIFAYILVILSGIIIILVLFT